MESLGTEEGVEKEGNWKEDIQCGGLSLGFCQPPLILGPLSGATGDNDSEDDIEKDDGSMVTGMSLPSVESASTIKSVGDSRHHSHNYTKKGSQVADGEKANQVYSFKQDIHVVFDSTEVVPVSQHNRKDKGTFSRWVQVLKNNHNEDQKQQVSDIITQNPAYGNLDVPSRENIRDVNPGPSDIITQNPAYGGLDIPSRENVRDINPGPSTDRPRNELDLRRYDVRKSTYTKGPHSWPHSINLSEQLARVGFIFNGVEDEVECFVCHIKLDDWLQSKPDPLLRHFITSPNCPFLVQDFQDHLPTLQEQSKTYPSKYADTSIRLHSFATWPFSEIVTSYQLVSVGFYYTGEDAKVTCFSCGLTVSEWKRGDVPLLVHRNRKPDCLFLESIIKKGQSSPKKPEPRLKMLATTGSSGATNRPDYSDLETRVKSFKKLSSAFPIQREKLADAGLYLLRLPDIMKCFSCSVLVHDWIDGDTAVEKHRAANPHCDYLKRYHPCKLDRPPSFEESSFDPSSLPGPQFDEQSLTTSAESCSKSGSYFTRQVPTTPDVNSLPPPLYNPETYMAKLSLQDTSPPTFSNSLSTNAPSERPYSGSGIHQPSLSLSGYQTLTNDPYKPSSYQSTSVDTLTHPPSSLSKSSQPPSLLSHHHSSLSPSSSLVTSDPRSSSNSLTSSGFQSSGSSGRQLSSFGSSSSGRQLSSALALSGPPSTQFTPSSTTIPPSSSSSADRFPATYIGGKPVALPPSYSHSDYSSMSGPPQAMPSDHSQQMLSLPLGTECVVCMDRPLEMVLVPCGHVCVCEICSKHITRCPMCRTRTQMSVKVYYPY